MGTQTRRQKDLDIEETKRNLVSTRISYVLYTSFSFWVCCTIATGKRVFLQGLWWRDAQTTARSHSFEDYQLISMVYQSYQYRYLIDSYILIVVKQLHWTYSISRKTVSTTATIWLDIWFAQHGDQIPGIIKTLWLEPTQDIDRSIDPNTAETLWLEPKQDMDRSIDPNTAGSIKESRPSLKLILLDNLTGRTPYGTLGQREKTLSKDCRSLAQGSSNIWKHSRTDPILMIHGQWSIWQNTHIQWDNKVCWEILNVNLHFTFRPKDIQQLVEEIERQIFSRVW